MILKFLKMAFAGCLVSTGALFLAVTLAMPFDPDQRNNPDWVYGMAVGAVLGVVPLGWGGWIFWGLHRDRQLRRPTRADPQAQLRRVLFDLLQQTGGEVTLVQFAMTANLSGQDAKAFLDQAAVDFDATFRVGESGEIYYQFPVQLPADDA